jgi:hypothetical protein
MRNIAFMTDNTDLGTFGRFTETPVVQAARLHHGRSEHTLNHPRQENVMRAWTRGCVLGLGLLALAGCSSSGTGSSKDLGKRPSHTPAPTLTTGAVFPEGSFLENLAVRRDGSILVTVLNRKEVWYVPARRAELPVKPMLVHKFAHMPMGIVEAEPDIFYSRAGQAAPVDSCVV